MHRLHYIVAWRRQVGDPGEKSASYVLSLFDVWVCSLSQVTVFTCLHICSIYSIQYVCVGEVFSVVCAWTVSPSLYGGSCLILDLTITTFQLRCLCMTACKFILLRLHFLSSAPPCLMSRLVSVSWFCMAATSCVHNSMMQSYACGIDQCAFDSCQLCGWPCLEGAAIVKDLGRQFAGGETCHSDLISRRLVAPCGVGKRFCNRSLTSRRLVCCHSMKCTVRLQPPYLRLTHVAVQKKSHLGM